MDTGSRRRTLEVFLYLQILDVLSTLIGFRLGNAEASPFIRLLIRWGPMAGLGASKLFAVGLGLVCYRPGRAGLLRWIKYLDRRLIRWKLYTLMRVLNS